MSRFQDALRLARDTSATGSWMVLRLLSLGIWLLVMAKLVSAADFGWLASTLGVAAVCAMFVGAGIPYLFFSAAHEDSPLALEIRWSELLGCLALLGPIIVLVALLGIVVWMPSPISVLLLLALLIVEIPLTGLVQSSALLLHAKRNFGAAAGLPAMMTVGRALAAALALAMDLDFSGYLVAHLLMAITVAAFVLLWASRKGSALVRPRIPSVATCRSAASYASMAGASLASGELDKPLLVKVAGLEATGNYALAYRICSAVAMPTTALSASLLPRWARMWAEYQHAALRRSFLAMFVVVAIASVAISAILILVLDSLSLRDLGLRDAVLEMACGLVWIIGPIGLHQLAGTALLAISRPLLRTLFDAAGLALLVGAFACFYFQLGTRGLALACVLVESLVACLMAAAFLSSISRLHGAIIMDRNE